MKGLSLNSEGYIRINSEEWGDIIILKMTLFQELMTSKDTREAREASVNAPMASETRPSEEYLFSKEFGNWIYQTLRERKITQAVLARALLTTQATISRVVSNSTKVVPSVEIRVKIYDYLK